MNATSDTGERRRAIYVGYDMSFLVHCLGLAWREPDDTPGYWHFAPDDSPNFVLICHEDDLLLGARIDRSTT